MIVVQTVQLTDESASTRGPRIVNPDRIVQGILYERGGEKFVEVYMTNGHSFVIGMKAATLLFGDRVTDRL